ncbi:MAG: pilus assembly protein TadG-related protein [Actinomycetota bacterium]
MPRHLFCLVRREDGAIAPIMAAAILGLVVVSMWGANVVTIQGARRELQRAADLGALAGAANLPLVGLLSTGEPFITSCRYADDLLGPGGAPLANNLSTTKAGPTCATGTITVDPIIESPAVEQVQAALEDTVDGIYDTLGSPNICSPLVMLLDPLLQLLASSDCQRLQSALDGLPQNLSPATVTPRVRVTITDAVVAPVPMPGVFDEQRTLRTVAEARRRFKNLIVLPAVRTDALTGLVEPVDDLVTGAPAPLHDINPNPTAAAACGSLLPKVQEANDALAAELAGTVDFDLSQLILDARDLCDPPGGAAPVSPLDLAVEAARTGDPVVILRLFTMPVLGIPALDFTAAYLTQIGPDSFQATPIPLEELTSARGLFGGTLVG